MKVYETLKDDCLNDPLLGTLPATARDWMARMLDYTIVGGKMNRGLAVLEALREIKGDVTEEEEFLANVAGWGIEILQAFFLVVSAHAPGSRAPPPRRRPGRDPRSHATPDPPRPARRRTTSWTGR